MSRYTVEDAAAVLGMTTGAVRNRVSQGTLRSVEEHGTVYVLLPADTARDMSSALMSEMRDRIAFLERELGVSSALVSEERGRIASLERELEETGSLVSEERERVASLERELEEAGSLVSRERQRVASLERELERKDAILRNIAEAIKGISSPTEQLGRGGPREQPLESAQEPAQERRPRWWAMLVGNSSAPLPGRRK
jgi:hypothetical protein